jgi:hypothetical protein
MQQLDIEGVIKNTIEKSLDQLNIKNMSKEG